MTSTRRGKITWWTTLSIALALLVAVGWYHFFRGSPEDGGWERIRNVVTRRPSKIRVQLLHPQKGGMDRTTVQPCTVHAYESAKLYAEVSGYLKSQTVDIGSEVKKGLVLAVIDAPELEKQVQRNRAGVDQAKARVKQMEARVASATADWKAAQADVARTEAKVKSTQAWTKFRAIQLGRFTSLAAMDTVEKRLRDEYQENYEAAKESERDAEAGVVHAQAVVLAKLAMIEQAKADVTEAESQIQVARAELEKSEVLMNFATIPSPFAGVITQRSMLPGDFVRAASGGAGPQLPLLTVESKDKLRIVVQVPDRDVPFANVGDTATIELDALAPLTKFQGAISRIANAEDPQTRLMRVEIDLPNPTGKIMPGMFGRATIVLEKAPDVLSIPTSCLVGQVENGKGKVYVVRDGKAWLVPVETGSDNGARIPILKGLTEADWVVQNNPNGLSNGAAVDFPLARAALQTKGGA